MAKKNGLGSFATSFLIAGTFAMIISYLAFQFDFGGFIGEVHSEVFGVGFGLFFVGISSLLFKKKLS